MFENTWMHGSILIAKLRRLNGVSLQFHAISMHSRKRKKNNEMESDLFRRKAQKQKKEFQFYNHALTEVTAFEHLPTTSHTKIKKKEKQRKER